MCTAAAATKAAAGSGGRGLSLRPAGRIASCRRPRRRSLPASAAAKQHLQIASLGGGKQCIAVRWYISGSEVWWPATLTGATRTVRDELQHAICYSPRWPLFPASNSFVSFRHDDAEATNQSGRKRKQPRKPKREPDPDRAPKKFELYDHGAKELLCWANTSSRAQQRPRSRHSAPEQMNLARLAVGDPTHRQVPALLASVFSDEVYSPEHFAQRLRQPKTVCFAGLVGGRMVGAAVLTLDNGAGLATLDFLAVAAAVVGERRGFGRRLLELVVADLRAGSTGVHLPLRVLFTDASKEATGFYSKCGFELAGRGARTAARCPVLGGRPLAYLAGRVRQERVRLAAALDAVPQPHGSTEMGIVLR